MLSRPPFACDTCLEKDLGVWFVWRIDLTRVRPLSARLLVIITGIPTTDHTMVTQTRVLFPPLRYGSDDAIDSQVGMFSWMIVGVARAGQLLSLCSLQDRVCKEKNASSFSVRHFLCWEHSWQNFFASLRLSSDQSPFLLREKHRNELCF